jgi:hypothetical protein
LKSADWKVGSRVLQSADLKVAAWAVARVAQRATQTAERWVVLWVAEKVD